MKIPNNVKVRRTTLGLSAYHLAEAVGISPSTLYHIENGTAEHISHSLIQRLTTILKCSSVRDLFPGTMCPEIAKKDMRAHKRVHRNGEAECTEIAIDESSTVGYPLCVGDRVKVRESDLHERSYIGEVVTVSKRLFVVRHPKGFSESFRWDDIDGCHVRILKEDE